MISCLLTECCVKGGKKVCWIVYFRYIIESSLLKLLCSLLCLFEVIPLQPLRLDFFGINFPSYPQSQLPFINFRGQVNKGKVAQSPWLRSPPKPDHNRDMVIYPISHLFTAKVGFTPHCAIPRFLVPLEECFPCVWRNSLTLLFLRCFHYGKGRGGGGWERRQRRNNSKDIVIPKEDCSRLPHDKGYGRRCRRQCQSGRQGRHRWQQWWLQKRRRWQPLKIKWGQRRWYLRPKS